METQTDCKSAEGIATQLVDTVILSCTLLMQTPELLQTPAVQEALKDMIQDTAVQSVLKQAAKLTV